MLPLEQQVEILSLPTFYSVVEKDRGAAKPFWVGLIPSRRTPHLRVEDRIETNRLYGGSSPSGDTLHLRVGERIETRIETIPVFSVWGGRIQILPPSCDPTKVRPCVRSWEVRYSVSYAED